MARIKIICSGKNSDGSQCKNWAIKNSYYCAIHQNQNTEDDIKRSQQIQAPTTFVIIALVVVVFIISMLAGCEKEFLKWLGG
ncbi:MAG: hypothetical protein PVF17_04290 [Ignavibacteria bacterium]